MTVGKQLLREHFVILQHCWQASYLPPDLYNTHTCTCAYKYGYRPTLARACLHTNQELAHRDTHAPPPQRGSPYTLLYALKCPHTCNPLQPSAHTHTSTNTHTYVDNQTFHLWIRTDPAVPLWLPTGSYTCLQTQHSQWYTHRLHGDIISQTDILYHRAHTNRDSQKYLRTYHLMQKTESIFLKWAGKGSCFCSEWRL